LGGYLEVFDGHEVIRSRFRRRDTADWSVQARVLEPVDPFECLVFDGLEGLPWPEPGMTFILNGPIKLSV
jgi:hypothetical protein